MNQGFMYKENHKLKNRLSVKTAATIKGNETMELKVIQSAEPKIHPTAVIDPTAILHKNVVIGPYAVIGENCEIGEGSVIGAHAVIAKTCAWVKKTTFTPMPSSVKIPRT